jgi:predicted nucleic acid-binding protein
MKNMAIKLFLDTNILLDLLDVDRPFAKEAKPLFLFIENGICSAYISESVITTVDYILQKKFNAALRISFLKAIINLVTILPCTNEIVSTVLQNNPFDIEDEILFELATSTNLDYFITNDKDAQKKLSTKKLPAISTKAFLKIMKAGGK